MLRELAVFKKENMRSIIVDELCEEHNLIIDIMDEIVECGVGSNGAINKIYRLESVIVKHLESEENLIYPSLMEHAENNPRYREAAKRCAMHLGRLSMQIGAFFDFFHKQERLGAIEGNPQIEKKFHEMCDVLRRRMHKEETDVFNFFLQIECPV
ncbi:hemerythrin domain-containing protein [Magnetococcales bacterium HHB-1]